MDQFELDQENNGMLAVVVEFPDLEEAALADEQAMLRYEEHITELLVTITNLNGKIEELQHNGGREEDEFLDQCSQYTSSLPRCVWQSKRLETTPHLNKECERMLLSGEDKLLHGEESSELFAELQQVLASLENVVSCRRSRTLSLQSTEGAADTELHSVSTNVENWSLEQWSEAFEALDDMEGVFGECSALTVEEQSWYKAEVSTFREKNLALKLALGGKEAEIDRSKVALRTFQEERDRLQRKVKELQETLQRAESPPSLPSSRSSSFSGAVSPSPEEEDWVFHLSLQDTITTVQSLVYCLQNSSRLRHLCQLLPLQPGMLAPENKVKQLEAQTEYLGGCIDKLKCLNDLLVVTLEECKSDSERMSMMLGKHESNSTALHIAVQASECRIAVHDLLQMHTDRNQELLLRQVTNDGTLKCQLSLEEFESKKEMVLSEAKVLLHKMDLITATEDSDFAHPTQVSSSNGNRFGLSCEEEKLLKDYIFKLGQDQASIKVTLVEQALKGCPQPMDVMRINEVIKAKVDDAMEASLDILPGYAVKPNFDRAQLLQNLSALREEMADLKTELYLREKEKRGLELQAMAHGHQEAAYMLLTEHLKWELEDGSEWCSLLVRSGINTADGSSCTEGDGESPTDSNEPDDECDECEEPSMMQELMQSLARCNALQSHIEELSLALEKSAREECMKKSQSIELTTDFFRAHSNLVSAYKNSRRKQADQLRRLENQVELMSRRHQGQVRSLRQRVERLEAGRTARVPGETSL